MCVLYCSAMLKCSLMMLANHKKGEEAKNFEESESENESYSSGKEEDGSVTEEEEQEQEMNCGSESETDSEYEQSSIGGGVGSSGGVCKSPRSPRSPREVIGSVASSISNSVLSVKPSFLHRGVY